jgi:hypothetical protein
MKTYRKREFLSKEGLPAIQFCVKCTGGGYIDAEVVISDTYNCVSLNFSSGTQQAREEMLSKVRLLIGEFARFQDALIQADQEHPLDEDARLADGIDYRGSAE